MLIQYLFFGNKNDHKKKILDMLTQWVRVYTECSLRCQLKANAFQRIPVSRQLLKLHIQLLVPDPGMSKPIHWVSYLLYTTTVVQSRNWYFFTIINYFWIIWVKLHRHQIWRRVWNKEVWLFSLLELQIVANCTNQSDMSSSSIFLRCAIVTNYIRSSVLNINSSSGCLPNQNYSLFFLQS